MKSTSQETPARFEDLFGDLRSLMQRVSGTPSEWLELLAMLEKFDAPMREQAALPYAMAQARRWDDDIRRFSYRMPHGTYEGGNHSGPDFRSDPDLWKLARCISIEAPVSAIEHFCEAPLEHIRQLRLSGLKLTSDEDINAVLGLLVEMPNLTSLEMVDVGLGRCQVELLQDLPQRASLETLKITDASLSAKHARQLTRTPFGALKMLCLTGTFLAEGTVDDVLLSAGSMQLEGFGLPMSNWTWSLIRKLQVYLDDPRTEIKHLVLDRSGINGELLKELVSSTGLRSVTRLDCADCGLGYQDMITLAGSRNLRNVRAIEGLLQGSNKVTAAAWQKLCLSITLHSDAIERLKRAGAPRAEGVPSQRRRYNGYDWYG